MERLRVLISYDIPYPRFDGVSNALRYLHSHFVNQDIKVLLLFPRPKTATGIQHQTYQSIQPIGIATPAYPDCPFGIPLIPAKEVIERFKPDIVHALAPFALGFSVIRASKRAAIPTIGTFNTNVPAYIPYYGFGFLKSFAWTIYRRIHDECDINLAPSNVVRAEMESHGIQRTAVWERGVDTERFSPRKRSRQVRSLLTKGHPERKILLYVGRLSPEKNLLALYKAVKGMRNVHTVLIGGGPLKQYLSSLFSGDVSTFAGFLDGEELAAAYASADLFVSPSLTEGFANVVLEALASGVPAIGFDSNGVSEIIKKSGGGLLASRNSYIDLREKIHEYLETPGSFERLGAAGREYAQGKTWARCFDDLLSYYSELL